MLELGKIDESEYGKAEKEVNNGLDFDQGEIEIGDCIYSYHTDALINEVIQDLADEKNISEAFAKIIYTYQVQLYTVHKIRVCKIK